MLQLGILISGRGSNMESILKTIKSKKIPINPAVVVSNKADAKGLKIAQKLGVPIKVIPSKGFSGSREKYDMEIIKVFKKYGVTPDNGLICLAGFMKMVSPKFVKKYENRIINIHPSLLPAFPGLGAQKQALDYGVKYSGCTVHFVDVQMDAGPIIIQATVKVKENDTEQTLSKRILEKEHEIYPKAVSLFAKKQIKIVGRQVIIIS